MKKVLFLTFALSLILSSCVKDPEPFCFQDPRAPFLGEYFMTDSVFFLGNFTEIKEYVLTMETDTLRGDTVVLTNLFGADFGFDPYAILTNGDFFIPSQTDGEADVFGSGFIAGDIIQYTAEYDDGGYEFRGYGLKN